MIKDINGNAKQNYFRKKIVLVTGGAGSIGKELCRHLLSIDIKALRILDNNETGLFDIEQELNDKRIRTFVGDIRDKDRLQFAVENVDIIFHAAALKHVPLCEYNPFEAIKTNVIGTQNLIDVAIRERVKKFVLISSDKAVHPVNVMGATKLLAEKLTISANLYKGSKRCIFSCVRFGNVIGSRGSVIPVFQEQIKTRKMITITDPSMTRFFMKISEAIQLIIEATTIARGGEIYILKMPSIKLKHLAECIIKQYAPLNGWNEKEIKIKYLGKRIGEKKHEELMTEDELHHGYELKNLIVINDKNQQTAPFSNKLMKYIYSNRSKKMKKSEIAKLL